jgi:hypothetical protein
MSSGREVDNRQAAMPHRQSYISLVPVPLIVGSAMSQCAGHRGAGSVQIRRCSIYESSDAAHD